MKKVKTFLRVFYSSKKMIYLTLLLSVFFMSSIFSLNRTNDFNGGSYYTNSVRYLESSSPTISKINISTYSWDTYSDNLNTISLASNFSFSIEDKDTLNPAKEKYYYISNYPLTSAELSGLTWTAYTTSVDITTNGTYIIYGKIVDNGDVVSYVNSDIVNFGSIDVHAAIILNNNTWNTFKSDINTIHINKDSSLVIDTDSTISSSKYYISTNIMGIAELNQVTAWINSNSIDINDLGTYIIYVKLTTTNNDVYYINTDKVLYDGYNQSDILLGTNPNSYNNTSSYISSKSSLNMTYAYINTNLNFESNYTHNLISTLLFPINTKLTLVDNNTNKAYEYTIITSDDIYGYSSSCEGLSNCTNTATYPFTLFKEVGKSTVANFNESNYANKEFNDNFTIFIDFSKTNMTSNYSNVYVYSEIRNGNNGVISTLEDTKKSFSVYYENDSATLKLTTDYNGTIVLNSDSTTNINLSSYIDYQTINSKKIFDTTYENKRMGLLIKVIDSNNNVVDSSYLKNMVFELDGINYYPDSDNFIRIKISDDILDTNKTLNINTFKNNGDLVDGTYYIKIYNFVSYDGLFYEQLGSNEISISLIVNSGYNKEYTFDVLSNINNNTLKKTEQNNIEFKILQSGNLSTPNIKISMYKKNSLTAYNQDYTIVDMSSLITNEMTLTYGDNHYTINSPIVYDGTIETYNLFNVSFDMTKLENTGYKLLFELYDGTNKVGEITKYIIVR